MQNQRTKTDQMNKQTTYRQEGRTDNKNVNSKRTVAPPKLTERILNEEVYELDE